jgi:hypothetical protein
VTNRFVDTNVMPGNSGIVTTSCNTGEVATGGGYSLLNGNITTTLITENAPFPDNQSTTPTGWKVVWFNNSGTTDTVRVWVVCAAP